MPDERSKRKKWPFIVGAIALFIFTAVFVGIIWYATTEPASNDSENDDIVPNDDEGLLSEDTTIWWYAIFIMIGLIFVTLTGFVLFIFMRGKRNPSSPQTKIPVPPKRAKLLWRQAYAREYHIPCRYDANNQVYEPQEKDAIEILKSFPYYDRATGDRFLKIEFIAKAGLHHGVHISFVPIDKGEQAITDEDYRYESDTSDIMAKKDNYLYPMSSVTDKKERQNLLMLEEMRQGNVDAESIKAFGQASAGGRTPSEFSDMGALPFPDMENEESMENTLPAPIPPRRTPDRRYTRNRRRY